MKIRSTGILEKTDHKGQKTYAPWYKKSRFSEKIFLQMRLGPFSIPYFWTSSQPTFYTNIAVAKRLIDMALEKAVETQNEKIVTFRNIKYP